jgi:hypothetical protein
MLFMEPNHKYTVQETKKDFSISEQKVQRAVTAFARDDSTAA